jgi:hypothetical protein
LVENDYQSSSYTIEGDRRVSYGDCSKSGRRKRSERAKYREPIEIDTTAVKEESKTLVTSEGEIEIKDVSTMDQFANFLLAKQLPANQHSYYRSEEEEDNDDDD